jgi:LPS O-antigen subunit length determinant protein (WzzB/FepE family)
MNDSSYEIDFIKILKKIYIKKKFIVVVSCIATFFGILYTLSLPNEYTSSTTFIPQLSSVSKPSGSSLSGLASLAGINIGGVENSSEFPPTLYPQVVNGIHFQLDLLSTEIEFNNKNILVKDYLLNKSSSNSFKDLIIKYTIGLPQLIFSSTKEVEKSIKNSKIYAVSKEDKVLFNTISNALSLSINQKEGFITISFSDNDKSVAAQITQISQNLLQKKIIEFKNQSSKEMLDFALKQYNAKKSLYEKKQDERAIFVDKNINISSSLFQNKLSRLESELSISKSIVQQLAAQVEQARLQVNKSTPVFTTIQPVTIPFQRSAPKRSLIVIFFAFSGFIISTAYILVEKIVKQFYDFIKS